MSDKSSLEEFEDDLEADADLRARVAALEARFPPTPKPPAAWTPASTAVPPLNHQRDREAFRGRRWFDINYLGIIYSWGVVQTSLVSSGLSSPSTLSFVGGLAVCCMSGFALPAHYIIERIGPRNAVLVGGGMISFGQIASGWSTRSVAGLFVLQGLVVGTGCALCFMAVGPLPSRYFIRRRGLASGLVYSGAGIGGAAFSVLTQKLLDEFGIAWTFRILGFMAIGIFVPCLFGDSSLGPLTSLALSLYISGLAVVAMWPFARSPAVVAVFAVLNGAGTGGWFALLPSVAGYVLGDEKVSSGLGTIELCSCVGFLLGSPIAGFLLAASGGEGAGLVAYKPAMWYAGGGTLASAVLVTTVRLRASMKLVRI
ncbi:hypothetical protein MNV49_005439 [Pseudohyphozyma bogoriensis]|nr:hypothetical protein MNV49_005439 [Pseudohyphozyma bogoriensis]